MGEEISKTLLEVGPEAEGMRLDHFLARRMTTAGRYTLRQAIANGLVTVNQQARRRSYKLKAGDLVEVSTPIPCSHAFIPEAIPITVVFEDEHILVVDKPANMLVHPSKSVRCGTLMNALTHYLQQHDPSARPGLIHRLDRHTSGLMVIAKTEQAHRVLSRHFGKRMVTKKYLALVHGVVEQDHLEIRLPIAWTGETFPHWHASPEGRQTLTIVRVIERFRAFTLLEAEPKTGRTHQIRIHLAALGHPLVGEELYARQECESSLLRRHFLHASFLQFRHPRTGQWLCFTSPLPQELDQFIRRLRQNAK